MFQKQLNPLVRQSNTKKTSFNKYPISGSKLHENRNNIKTKTKPTKLEKRSALPLLVSTNFKVFAPLHNPAETITISKIDKMTPIQSKHKYPKKPTLIGCWDTCLHPWHCSLKTIFLVVLACLETHRLLYIQFLNNKITTKTQLQFQYSLRIHATNDYKSYLLVKHGLCLTSITRLFAVITTLSLSSKTILTLLILCDLMQGVLPAIFTLAVRLLCLWNVHLQHKQKFISNLKSK